MLDPQVRWTKWAGTFVRTVGCGGAPSGLGGLGALAGSVRYRSTPVVQELAAGGPLPMDPGGDQGRCPVFDCQAFVSVGWVADPPNPPPPPPRSAMCDNERAVQADPWGHVGP